MGNRVLEVSEEVVLSTPFGALLRFRKDSDLEQPRLLVVAPMSGHFATLLRGTVEALLPDHDVYITDWANARDVPPSAGPFCLDDFLDHIIRFLRGDRARAPMCWPCASRRRPRSRRSRSWPRRATPPRRAAPP